jgi:hypothetical protein
MIYSPPFPMGKLSFGPEARVLVVKAYFPASHSLAPATHTRSASRSATARILPRGAKAMYNGVAVFPLYHGDTHISFADASKNG